MGSKKPLSRKNDLVIQEHNHETLVYDLLDHRALCLNETARDVWRACDGRTSVEEIANAIGSEDLVWLALRELKREGLIDLQPPTPIGFEGMSRREVIRKIGLGSAIALPIIASIVAPPASHAASCKANDAPCSLSAECCSLCCKNVSPAINQCKPGGGACLP